MAFTTCPKKKQKSAGPDEWPAPEDNLEDLYFDLSGEMTAALHAAERAGLRRVDGYGVSGGKFSGWPVGTYFEMSTVKALKARGCVYISESIGEKQLDFVVRRVRLTPLGNAVRQKCVKAFGRAHRCCLVLQRFGRLVVGTYEDAVYRLMQQAENPKLTEKDFGSIAQQIEHALDKREAGGANPSATTTLSG